MNAAGALRAELEARCLRGLGEAAGALAGEDPAAVCQVLARWQEEARRPWPWLAGMSWAALEPLGVTFPADDRHAVVAGRLLVGTETDPIAVDRAVESLRERQAPDAAAGATRGGDPQATLQQRRLSTAVDAFWVTLVRAARRLHEHVREGDRSGADDLVIVTRRRLEELAERVAHLADSSLALVGATERPAGRLSGGGLPQTILVDGEPSGPLVVPKALAAAPPRPARKRAPVRRGRSDGQHEYTRSSDHSYAPVVFAVAVIVTALVWLARIAQG